jgi:signal transduction histidine kinase
MDAEAFTAVVIEDDAEDYKSLVDSLTSYGLVVQPQQVSDLAGLTAALEQTPDFVLCDYVVPGMTWEQGLSVVRQDNQYTPFIVVSGKRGEEVVSEVMRAGCDDFVAKDRLLRLAPVVVRAVANARESQASAAYQETLEHRLRQAEKFEAMGRVAAGLAHNLGNQLASVSSLLELALHVQDPPSTRKYAELAAQACDQTRELTQRFTRLHESRNFRRDWVEISSVVEQLASFLAPGMPRRISLSTRVSDEVGSVSVDKSGLEQALGNLIANARDAIPGDGTIEIDADGDDGAWTLRVRDSGSGMDQDTLSKILEPFFTTKGSDGTGLGLPSVYQFVKDHGGTMDIDSEPMLGTTVSLTLPRKPAADGTAAARAATVD